MSSSTGARQADFASPEALTAAVREIALAIAAKSPFAMRGLKECMNFSRDHTVGDSLNFVASWNAALLISGDLFECIIAQREYRTPYFED
jgi:enoyl-CoA hydratase